MIPERKTLDEITSIITDQINRHVAMTDTHRAWLAKDISVRVCAVANERLNELRALLEIAANNAHDSGEEDSFEDQINAVLSSPNSKSSHGAAQP